jgi:1-deoxy-D-xylulose-5-phosphate reductoisomerase
MKKKIVIIGSTGSIGKNTLNILRKDKKNLKLKYLSTNKNFKKL